MFPGCGFLIVSRIVKNTFSAAPHSFFFFFIGNILAHTVTWYENVSMSERAYTRLFCHVFTVTFFLMTLVEMVISGYCYALNRPINYLKGVFWRNFSHNTRREREREIEERWMMIIRICHEENLFPFASFRNKRISQPSTKLYSWTRDGHSKPAYLRDLIWKHVWQPDYNKQSAVFYRAVVLVEFLNIKHHVPGSTILIVLPINKSHRVTKTYSSLVVVFLL